MSKRKHLNFNNSAPDLKLLDTSGKPVRAFQLVEEETSTPGFYPSLWMHPVQGNAG